MKIAYIMLKGLPLGGGVEKYTEEIGARLVERGHEVVVYTQRNFGTRDGYYRGMKIKTVPTLNMRGFDKLLATLYASIMQAFEPNVDIVHFHGLGSAYAGLFPRLMKRRVVMQGHGIEWMRSRWSPAVRLLLKCMEKIAMRFTEGLTVVSKVQQDYLKETYGRESIVIRNGVNLPCELSPSRISGLGLEGQKYILFAARLVEEKGAHYLIDAFRAIETDMKLVIAGDAKHEEVYKGKLKKLAGDDPRILFPGFVHGELLSELFSNAYLFVLPSDLEGLPIALLEAMSYGNCCLVSDIQENLEALEGNGFTFRQGNVESLREELRRLILSPEIVAEIRPKAKDYVLAEYTWDKVCDRVENFYRNI